MGSLHAEELVVAWVISHQNPQKTDYSEMNSSIYGKKKTK